MDDVKYWCDDPLGELRMEFRQKFGDMFREVDDMWREVDDIRRQVDDIRGWLDDERHYQELRLTSRRKVLYHEVIDGAYSVLGHNQNNPRGTTFDYIRNKPAILQEAFGFCQCEIRAVLDALDPYPSQSWIIPGNRESYGFSIAEAKLLARDATIKKLLYALTGHAEDDSTLIGDAISIKRNDLGLRMQAVKDIMNLPNPKYANPAFSAEVIRIVENHLRLNYPWLIHPRPPLQPPHPQPAGLNYPAHQYGNPPPPGVDLSTSRRGWIDNYGNASLNIVRGVERCYPYHSGKPESL